MKTKEILGIVVFLLIIPVLLGILFACDLDKRFSEGFEIGLMFMSIPVSVGILLKLLTWCFQDAEEEIMSIKPELK